MYPRAAASIGAKDAKARLSSKLTSLECAACPLAFGAVHESVSAAFIHLIKHIYMSRKIMGPLRFLPFH